MPASSPEGLGGGFAGLWRRHNLTFLSFPHSSSHNVFRGTRTEKAWRGPSLAASLFGKEAVRVLRSAQQRARSERATQRSVLQTLLNCCCYCHILISEAIRFILLPHLTLSRTTFLFLFCFSAPTDTARLSRLAPLSFSTSTLREAK